MLGTRVNTFEEKKERPLVYGIEGVAYKKGKREMGQMYLGEKKL